MAYTIPRKSCIFHTFLIQKRGFSLKLVKNIISLSRVALNRNLWLFLNWKSRLSLYRICISFGRSAPGNWKWCLLFADIFIPPILATLSCVKKVTVVTIVSEISGDIEHLSPEYYDPLLGPAMFYMPVFMPVFLQIHINQWNILHLI